MSSTVLEETSRTAPYVPSTLLRYQDPMPISEAEIRYKSKLERLRRHMETISEKPTITNSEEVLDLILPPRTIEDNHLQFVSSEVPTRQDVNDLSQLFGFRLQDSKARKSGICSVRSAIYAMCFDELIRQITVGCPERGLLLMRIRDELRMTTDSYRILYEASVGLGRRKSIESERGKQQMANKIETLRTTKDSLTKEVRRLEAKLSAMERCCQEQLQADSKKYADEIAFLKHTNTRLGEQEETIKRLQEEEKRQMAA